MASHVGVPISPNTPGPTIHFDYLPDLWDLLPGFKWWLGVTYLMVCTHNQVKARRLGYSMIRGAEPFTILGPNGTADAVLMGAGVPIPGSSPHSGLPVLLTDVEVGKLTGHSVDPDGEFTISFKEQSDAQVHESARIRDGIPEGTRQNPGKQDRSVSGGAQRQNP